MRRFKPRRRSRHGMTLLEVMISMAISTVATSGIVALHIMATRVASDVSQFNLCSRNARHSLDRLSRDLRSASEVMASVTTEGGITYYSTSETLVLKLPALNTYYEPIDLDSCFDYIVYHPDASDPDRFMRTIVADPASRRDSGTQEVKFGVRAVSLQGWYASEPDALGTHVLHVQLISRRTTHHKTTEMPLSVSVKLRNKTN